QGKQFVSSGVNYTFTAMVGWLPLPSQATMVVMITAIICYYGRDEIQRRMVMVQRASKDMKGIINGSTP
ncbi:hypothetical protein RDWZM_001479, partial [Blomia tropicalis]